MLGLFQHNYVIILNSTILLDIIEITFKSDCQTTIYVTVQRMTKSCKICLYVCIAEDIQSQKY